jgi:gamma-glutamyltranspeptidase/glutathione hydrolase
MLNILEHFPLQEMGANTAASLHVMAEAMKFAFADRSKHLGDMDFYDVPVDWLIGKPYAAELAARINGEKALPSDEIAPGVEPVAESEDTTHYSVIDRFGNAVANTYTLNFSFGSGITVPGAGFLLNNEKDDFSAKPGVPNSFGLLGGAANAIAPGKRPLSSMTPTMVFHNDQPFLVTGSPGGSRIISTVLQHVVNMIDHRANVAEALNWPRIHHQWYPDRLEYEVGLNPDTIELLQSLGHNLRRARTMGSIQAISVDEGRVFGAADPRRPGAGAVAE